MGGILSIKMKPISKSMINSTWTLTDNLIILHAPEDLAEEYYNSFCDSKYPQPYRSEPYRCYISIYPLIGLMYPQIDLSMLKKHHPELFRVRASIDYTHAKFWMDNIEPGKVLHWKASVFLSTKEKSGEIYLNRTLFEDIEKVLISFYQSQKMANNFWDNF